MSHRQKYTNEQLLKLLESSDCEEEKCSSSDEDNSVEETENWSDQHNVVGNRVCLGVGNEEPIEYDDDSVADPDFIPNSPESDVSHNDIIRPVVRHSPSIGTSVTRRNILSQPSSSPIARRSCSPVTSRSPVAGCSSKSNHRRPTSVTRRNIVSQHSSSPTTRPPVQ